MAPSWSPTANRTSARLRQALATSGLSARAFGVVGHGALMVAPLQPDVGPVAPGVGHLGAELHCFLVVLHGLIVALPLLAALPTARPRVGPVGVQLHSFGVVGLGLIELPQT